MRCSGPGCPTTSRPAGDVVQSQGARRRSRTRAKIPASLGDDPLLAAGHVRVRRRAARRRRARAPGRARRLLAAPACLARGRGRGAGRAGRATPRRCSRTPSSTSGSRSSGSGATRSSRTSPTGSSPSTVRARSCSGTRPPRRSPASLPPPPLGRTPLEVLQRELASDDEGWAGERLVAIQRGRRGGDALPDRGRHARPGRRRLGPDLRVPRRLVGADRRADEVRLRLDRLPSAPSAADVDLRLRGDAPAARRALRRGRAGDVPRLHRLRGAAPDLDRRHAAQRREARGRRPPRGARPHRSPRRRLGGGHERPGRRPT